MADITLDGNPFHTVGELPRVVHAELVREIGDEPDYDAAVAAISR
jgi:peroxiredoxin